MKVVIYDPSNIVASETFSGRQPRKFLREFPFNFLVDKLCLAVYHMRKQVGPGDVAPWTHLQKPQTTILRNGVYFILVFAVNYGKIYMILGCWEVKGCETIQYMLNCSVGI